ncbi:MAG: hypothetical protein WAT09_15805 [Paracoccaceae bacterium]
MRHLITALALALIGTAALADPAPPQHGPQIARLELGVFCALQAMDRMPAPGTTDGWIHVPTGNVRFHWPDRQVVPAAIGLAFGVKATGAVGWSSETAEVRVYRPGHEVPDVWNAGISEWGGTLSFFRFDTVDELIPGLWRFEVWEGDIRHYQVQFQVVPADAVPDLVQACGAVS